MKEFCLSTGLCATGRQRRVPSLSWCNYDGICSLFPAWSDDVAIDICWAATLFGRGGVCIVTPYLVIDFSVFPVCFLFLLVVFFAYFPRSVDLYLHLHLHLICICVILLSFSCIWCILLFGLQFVIICPLIYRNVVLFFHVLFDDFVNLHHLSDANSLLVCIV